MKQALRHRPCNGTVIFKWPGFRVQNLHFSMFFKKLQYKMHIFHHFCPRFAAIYNVNSTFSLISSTVFGEPFEAIYIVNRTFSFLFLPPFHIIYNVACSLCIHNGHFGLPKGYFSLPDGHF